MLKKALIISYTFPPNQGIGGRRWAKFAKYLIRKDVDVQVVTSVGDSIDGGWNKDISELGLKVEQISFNYPYYLGINPKSVYEKIMYRLSLIWSQFNSKGNFFDKSIHGGKNIISRVEYYINKGYDNIIVTVAPFHIATHVSALISKYPKVNFIVDFRDPWVGNKTAYGYFSLSGKRKEYENESEKTVINSFTTLLTVSEGITNELKQKYPDSKANFFTIPNGFDTEDFKIELPFHAPKNDKICLVFTGTFYNEAKKYLIKLCEWLDELRSSDVKLYERLSINFYGNVNIDLSFTKKHSALKFNGIIPLNEVYEKIYCSDACLLFLTDDINYSFSTKFCEYLAFKKPIIVISNGGYTSEYVEQNKIGRSLIMESSLKDFQKIVLEVKENKESFYQLYDIQKFGIDRIVGSIYQLLK